MKITFISLFPDLTAFGLRYIASCVNKEGFETQIIFLPDPDFESIRSVEERYKYTYPETVMEQVETFCKDSDLVGLSVLSCYFQQAVQLSRRIRKLKIPVLWGGKHPSAMPEESLKYADMVCLGEGEEAVLELVDKMQRGKDYLDTENFWFSTLNSIRKNAVRPLMENLDHLPLLNYTFCPHFVWLKDRESIEPLNPEITKRFLIRDPFSKDGRIYQTMTTRGCPYNCTYCQTFKGLYKGQRYVRQRSVDNIILELETIKNTYDFITHVSFCDDEFAALKLDTIKEFSKQYKERIGLSLSCLGSPWNINDEKLELLVNAGLRLIQMGIQTASENGKKVYKRNIPNIKIMAAVNSINKYKKKVIPLYDFIIDNPYETKEDILETVRFILQIPKPYHLNIFSLIFLPGTALYQQALEDGIISKGEENYLKVYRTYQRRYLNLVLLLFNFRVLRPIIRVLISRPIVFLFEMKGVNRLLFSGIEALRRIKILTLLKRLQLLSSQHDE